MPTVQGPPVVDHPLRGELRFRVVRCSYADQPNPFTVDQMAVLAQYLDALIVRNSSGLCWARAELVDVQLPGTGPGYAESYQSPLVDLNPAALTPVQVDCLELVPDDGRTYRLFLLPDTGPAVYVGYGHGDHRPGYAWVSALPFAPGDLFSLPIPHEAGHTLGLIHAPSGIMLGDDQGAQRDWEGFFEPAQRRQLGWLGQ